MSEMVIAALVATHSLWAGPEEDEEYMVTNLNFDEDLEDTGPLLDISCRARNIPRALEVATPKKEEGDDDWKEEWITPEEYSTPLEVSKVKKKTRSVKIEDPKVENPPKLQLDQSWEEEKIPETPRRSKRSFSRCQYCH